MEQDSIGRVHPELCGTTDESRYWGGGGGVVYAEGVGRGERVGERVFS